MKTLNTSVDLECTPEKLWSIYLDEAFLRALYLEELQYPGFRVIDATQDSKKLHIVPKVNVPGPLLKLMGDFAYEQHGTLDRAKNEYTWKMVSPGGKKAAVSTRGTIRVTDAGGGRCRRSDEVVIEGQVFGLGGLIEASGAKETEKAWEKEFALLKRWIAK